jgi:hypothetical protein
MRYKLEKNIPIGYKNKAYKYPFAKMGVGDSFTDGDYDYDKMNELSTTARDWCRRMKNEWKFSVRKTQDDKLRIWRVK